MSEPVAARQGARYEGFCTLEEAGPVGMIGLRAELSAAKVARALLAATGAQMPGRLEITSGDKGRVAWMSPDELLLFVDYERRVPILARLQKALAASHALAVDVSDARRVFHLRGARAREVIAKLSPADLRGFGPGQFRRTRLAQVAAAFHMPDENSFEIIAFRSYGDYVFKLLANAARPGGEVGFPE